MSTRASITFKEDGKVLCHLYHHWDGYPHGLGVELCEWLKNRMIVNGIGSNIKENWDNGFSELVANYIRDEKIKSPHGNVYLQPEPMACGEEYHYVVEYSGDTISLKIYNDNPSQYFYYIKDISDWNISEFEGW
jgi:hypothetical protein